MPVTQLKPQDTACRAREVLAQMFAYFDPAEAVPVPAAAEGAWDRAA